MLCASTTYARRHRSAKLTGVLDRFYRSDYSVWGGKVEAAREAHDSAGLFSLLSERPGAFADVCTTLYLISAPTIHLSVSSIADRLPVRLLVSLSNGAAAYFLPKPTTDTSICPRVRGEASLTRASQLCPAGSEWT